MQVLLYSTISFGHVSISDDSFTVHFLKKKLDLLALEDTPLPSYSCVLPHMACKMMSADTLLTSVAALSTLEITATGNAIRYVIIHLVVVHFKSR